jgi:hypothetical protein
MDTETIRNEIEDAGKRHLEAAMSGDVEALEPLLAEELFYTHSNGFTDADKAAYLSFIAGGTYVRAAMTVDHSVERIIVLSDDLAIIKGKQITNTGNGSGVTGKNWDDVEATSLDTWIRRDGRWQLLAHQSTLVLDREAYGRAFAASH